MDNYPFTVPQILTDAIYTEYGGHTGTSTASQRSAAYFIAEARMAAELDAYLSPVIVTGTYPWPKNARLIMDHGYIQRVISVVVKSPECENSCELLNSDGCAIVLDETRGWIFVDIVSGSCSCCNVVPAPWLVQVVDQSGLSSGSVYRPDMLAALTIVAEIALNEMIDPGANESTGDVGVQDFQTQNYRETRIKLQRTALGNSARANYASRLVQRYKCVRVPAMR